MSERDETQHNPDDDQEARHREGLEFLVNVADQRIIAWMDANMPAVTQEVVKQVVDQLSQKINPDEIAVRAERIFEQRWNAEATRRRQAAGGGGGRNGTGRTATGGEDEGGDGDASFLDQVEGGDQEAHDLAPVAVTDRKQAVAAGAFKLLEDPLGSLERMLTLTFDVMDRRRPQQPQRHDLDVLEEIASRRPYLVDLFASQDPGSAPERLAQAMYDGARSGLSVAEAMAKYNLRDATRKPPPKWKPPEIDVPKARTVQPAAAAPVAQDRPRRRRRLKDAV
jgi:hypothetical protein